MKRYGSDVKFGIGEWIAVLGILLALIAWWHSTKSRELLVRVAPTVVEVLKDGVASDLAVSYKGRPITSGLRTYQVAIWNAGREPIRGEDVLKPIMLGWSSDDAVVEVKVVKTTRDEISFSVASFQRGLNQLKIDWRIMESNDGALVQFLVEGASPPRFSISGTIVGQGRVDVVKRGPLPKEPDVDRSYRWLLVAFSCFSLLLFTRAFVLEAKGLAIHWRVRPLPLRDVFLQLLALTAITAVFFAAAVTLYINTVPDSPFGF